MANRFWVTQPVSGAVVSVASPPQVRLTVASTTGMTTGDTRTVFGVVGTTEANGTWVITVIDGTHIDLQGTTFANLYTSGGSVNGRWDATNTNNWVTTSAGTNYGQTVPGTGDVVTLDGSSGGGTVTPNGPNSGAVTVQSITCGAFTGTLDFSANNNNVTLSSSTGFSGSGSGTRTINLGNGTWTLSSTSNSTPWDMGTTTNLTFNANSSTIILSGNTAATSTRTFAGGALTYSSIQVNGTAAGGLTTITGVNTIGTLTATGPNALAFGANQTITNLNLNGSSGAAVGCMSNIIGATQRTLTITTLTATWAAFRAIIGSGTATNSFDLGSNSGITITAPGSISVDTVTAAIMDARVMTPY